MKSPTKSKDALFMGHHYWKLGAECYETILASTKEDEKKYRPIIQGVFIGHCQPMDSARLHMQVYQPISMGTLCYSIDKRHNKEYNAALRIKPIKLVDICTKVVTTEMNRKNLMML